jgi:hypothetical protein
MKSVFVASGVGFAANIVWLCSCGGFHLQQTTSSFAAHGGQQLQ